jgi:Trp operon repressor
MLSKEKEDLVRKLLSEKRPSREIRKIVQCSPNEITRIRNKMNDENKQDNKPIKSKSITP